MDRRRIRELHYITDWRNIPSILQRGILSHQLAERVGHESVADPDVQARRAAVTITGGKPLHHYACLYFDARNSMLYKLRGKPRLAVLACDPAVVDLGGVIVSDRNAASGSALFRPAVQAIPLLDEDAVYAEQWGGDRDAKQRRCAEVLVPNRIAASTVRKVYVRSDADAAALEKDIPDLSLPVEVNAHLFFRGPKS